MTYLNQHWVLDKPLSRNTILKLWEFNTHQWTNIQKIINNTKYHQHNQTLPHNIYSQTKFNLKIIALLGKTSTQTFANSKLAFIFPNGSIKHNQTGVYFQCPTLIPMWVSNECSFKTLKSRLHNTFRLTNDQFVHEIYYQKSSIDASQQSFFILCNWKMMMMIGKC